MNFKLDKRSKRAIWLLSGTALYLVLGALVFSYFEYEQELQVRAEVSDTKERMQNKYNFTTEDFNELEDVVVRSIPFAAGLQWKFIGAFYFCTVVITTVGYGHSTPYTSMGKLFCMIFALVGIPLGLVTFQSVGERINHIIRCGLVKFGRFLTKQNINILREVKSIHLLFVSFTVGTLTIIAGTIVFHLRENWTPFDAYYYCVITLSTIGFGDFVPLQTRGHLQRDIGYVIFTLFFILFGLAIFSACVNLLILEFMAHNADIVTARTRLKRLLSLRGTPSFKNASFRGVLPTVYRRKRRRTMAGTTADATEEKKSVPFKDRSVSATDLTNIERMKTMIATNIQESNGKLTASNNQQEQKEQQVQQHKEEAKEDEKVDSYIRDVHGYYRLKPAYFTARRLPTRYIDHLVNTEKNSIILLNNKCHKHSNQFDQDVC